jgi:hypothetical protein
MAQTLQIVNGDVVTSSSNGRAILIGNPVGSSDPGAAKAKTVQDLQGALGIDRVVSGAGAGISEFEGLTNDIGSESVTMLINQRINDMFTAILSLQAQRPEVRPLSEQFNQIAFLQVVSDISDPTQYIFRLDTLTKAYTSPTTVSGSMTIP